jgi:GNAT superfamily N-acetyltransferase
MPGLKVVKADHKDTPLVLQMLRDLYIELGEEAESIQFLNESLINTLVRTGQTEVYIAYTAQGEAAGLITLTVSQAIYAGGFYGVIDEMYVRPAFRSAGIGALLVAHVKALAKNRGWKRIDVTTPTEPRWQRTQSFYKNCGFKFTGSKMKYSM